jgi:hypothetical protein
LQLSHAPSHALTQHTPSAQKFDEHWFDAVHDTAIARFARHAPLEQ